MKDAGPDRELWLIPMVIAYTARIIEVIELRFL